MSSSHASGLSAFSLGVRFLLVAAALLAFSSPLLASAAHLDGHPRRGHGKGGHYAKAHLHSRDGSHHARHKYPAAGCATKCHVMAHRRMLINTECDLRKCRIARCKVGYRGLRMSYGVRCASKHRSAHTGRHNGRGHGRRNQRGNGRGHGHGYVQRNGHGRGSGRVGRNGRGSARRHGGDTSGSKRRDGRSRHGALKMKTSRKKPVMKIARTKRGSDKSKHSQHHRHRYTRHSDDCKCYRSLFVADRKCPARCGVSKCHGYKSGKRFSGYRCACGGRRKRGGQGKGGRKAKHEWYANEEDEDGDKDEDEGHEHMYGHREGGEHVYSDKSGNKTRRVGRPKRRHAYTHEGASGRHRENHGFVSTKAADRASPFRQ